MAVKWIKAKIICFIDVMKFFPLTLCYYNKLTKSQVQLTVRYNNSIILIWKISYLSIILIKQQFG